MTDVLILGGTGWLSSRVAGEWTARGARVTALARGSRPAPSGVRLVTADRDDPDAYAAVSRTSWDEVVDVSSDPRHVEAAVDALATGAEHWTYVSTVSVYARHDVAGADETAATVDPLGASDSVDYPHAKAAAEAAVRASLDDRALIVRPGLIVGPGDPSDRFGYWVARFALAGDEAVLVPDTSRRGAQVIDVDDLAAFAVAAGASRRSGIVNAVGRPTELEALLEAARAVAGHRGEVVTATDEWLEAQGVAHWMGPRSLPLWLPPDMPGFWTRTNARYLSWGGDLRPLERTLASTLADERDRGLDRARRSGLTRLQERELLQLLG